MRTIALFTTLAALAILPAAGHAVEFVSVEGVADCNGWSSTATIWFRDGATSVDLSWSMVLVGADGAEIERSEGFAVLPITPGGMTPFTYTGAFAAAPPAGATLAGSYVLHDNFTDGFNETTAGFSADPACAPADDPTDGPADALCTHTARWWHHHPDQWPAESMTVGGDDWDARALARVLARPAWGNAGLLLARQLVAARFNALANPGAGMDDAMDAADAYLASHDPFERSRGRRSRHARQGDAAEVRALIEPLVQFNRLGCTEAPAAAPEDGGMTDTQILDKMLTGELVAPDADEPVSFGALKARFR
jgi:hypothetical protein